VKIKSSIFLESRLNINCIFETYCSNYLKNEVHPNNINLKNMKSVFWMYMLILFLGQSCVFDSSQQSSISSVPQYKFLRDDTINVFKVGEKFSIGTFENSCCTNCWLNNGKLSNQFLHKNLFITIDGMSEIENESCSGCTTRSKTIYKCIKTGKDTLYYVILTNGYVKEFGMNCEDMQIDIEAIERDGQSLIGMSRKYVIDVVP
jgi:hypothetical protein